MTAALARRLVVGIEGPQLSTDEADWLAWHRPAGVILFARNATGSSQAGALCRRLHGLLPHAEIMADHEGGPVAPLAAAVGRPPAAWGLGRLDDPDLTFRVCRETGRRLVDLGLDRVLAPVADVMTEPRNPVIGARAFGADAERCARHVVAAVTAYRDAGLAVCLKHWPGHGGTRNDSHEAPARLPDEAPRRPFVDGLAAGADAVMVGHLLAADARPGDPPTTLDASFLARSRRLLAPEAGSAIRLLADDVTMGALGPAMASLGVAGASGLPPGLVEPRRLPAGWLEALAAAGCDQLLVRGIPWQALPAPQRRADASPGATDPVRDTDVMARDDAVYGEARRRLWNSAAAGFADAGGELGWLDLTGGDRWEPADAGGMTAGSLATPLDRLFARVVRLDAETAPLDPLERILVTSHRPLPSGWRFTWPKADRGVALTMGHPSLASDVKTVLGAEWRVGSLYDTRPLELPGGQDPGQEFF